jgi:hypothetical protein
VTNLRLGRFGEGRLSEQEIIDAALRHDQL